MSEAFTTPGWQSGEAIEIERLRELNMELLATLRDCAEDLESFIEAHYPPAVRAYPSELRRYERDIASAKAARSIIAKAEGR